MIWIKSCKYFNQIMDLYKQDHDDGIWQHYILKKKENSMIIKGLPIALNLD